MILSATYVNPLGAVAGGDVAFVVPLDQGIRLVNADACSHGAAAYPLRAQLEAVLRKYAVEEKRPSSVIAQANHAVAESPLGEASAFAFATAIVLDLELGSLCAPSNLVRAKIASAGHWPPIAVAGTGMRAFCLTGRSNPPPKALSVNLPLGCDQDCFYTEASCELHDPKAVLVYSDGLVEMPVNGSGERLGLQRLREDFLHAVKSVPSGHAFDLMNHLRQTVNRRRPNRADDVSFIVVSFPATCGIH